MFSSNLCDIVDLSHVMVKASGNAKWEANSVCCIVYQIARTTCNNKHSQLALNNLAIQLRTCFLIYLRKCSSTEVPVQKI